MRPPDPASHRLRRRVAGFVRERGVLRPGERALLMLSGGADSMAMLDLVRASDATLGLALEMEALHVDYATRGEDSTRDRLIVARACAAAGVKLHQVRLERKLQGGGFQARARALRYERAREIAAAEGLGVIVTAHNRDDQAETVVYRLAKYASPRGLAGMRPRDADLARPLLCAGAAEIRAYCRAMGIEYGVDESNERRAYARNRIRLDVLPVLERINPRAVETIAAGAEMAADEGQVLEAAVRAALARVLAPPMSGDLALVDLGRLAQEAPALRALVIHTLLRDACGGEALVERRSVEAVLALSSRREPHGRTVLRAGLEAVRQGGLLHVRRRRAPHVCATAGLALDEAATAAGVTLTWCGRRLRVRLLAGAELERDPGHAFVALGASCGAVTLRHPRRGERFAPLGLGAETTVARFLAACRVPPEGRRRAAVLDVDGAVAWVGAVARDGRSVGRVAESFRVQESTVLTLHVFEEDS